MHDYSSLSIVSFIDVLAVIFVYPVWPVLVGDFLSVFWRRNQKN